jgi:uncharacterized membrane protein YagU involved in acid resistance
MNRYEAPMMVVIKGGIAGLAGTAVLTLAMKRAPEAMQRLGISTSEPPASEVQAQSERGAEEPTSKLAEKVAVGMLDTLVEEETKHAAGQAVHWGYGAAWGAMYGIVQSSLRFPDLLHGTVFGTIVGLVASTVVPAIGLTPPPKRQPMLINAMQMVYHLLYGWTTALTFRLLSEDN